MAGYLWPWPAGTRISQRFGTNPESPVNPAGGHTGDDAATAIGTVLRAPGDGVIEYAGTFGTLTGSDNPWLLTAGGGLTVVLNCGTDAPTFVFAHLYRALVPAGTRVRRGDPIVISGNSGRWTTGAHCHFEALPPRFDLSSPTYGRVRPGIYCRAYYTPTITTQGAPKDMAQPKDTAEAVWATRIQQYQEDGKTKGSIKPASFILGNLSQFTLRILAGQKAIRTDLARIEAKLDGKGPDNG